MPDLPAQDPGPPEKNGPIRGRVLRLGRKYISLEVEGQLRFKVPYRLSRKARDLTGAQSVLFQWEGTDQPGRASVLIHGPAPTPDTR